MRQVLFNWLGLAILFTASCCIKAQCPAGLVEFNTQAQINQFIIDYPNCTEINGRIIIGAGTANDINDLTPLQNITSAHELLIRNTSLLSLTGLNNFNVTDNANATLAIQNNPNLTDISALNNISNLVYFDIMSNGALSSLNGLNNLTNITYSASIWYNDSLLSFDGLQGLTNVSQQFRIESNNSLQSLDGLENLTLAGSIWIKGNNSLENVDGLSALTQLTNGGLTIQLNPSLISLQGFSNLTTLTNKPLKIESNNALTTLTGLDNIDPSTITGAGPTRGITIRNSASLSLCSIPSICGYLEAGGNYMISGNSVGCNSFDEVQTYCEDTGDCPEGDVILSTQSQVNAFIILHPNCTSINGNLYIGVEEGLSDIVNLNGLENIVNIIGSLTINNTSLTNLQGLQNTEQIGGNLSISNNGYLISLEALENLTNINSSSITIQNNSALTSLEGLQNVDPASINGLVLQSSQNLSACDVGSICTYVTTFGSSYTISGNATGCNSAFEISETCQDSLPQCPSGDVTFLTQAEINHFALQYPNCTQIQEGVIRIGILQQENDITDLTPLENLETVGNLAISRTLLTDLEGLNNLTTVNNSLEIINNDNLSNLVGLDNLTSANTVFIQENDNLENLEGIESLEHVITELTIRSNPSLVNLNGLNGLKEVGILGSGAGDFSLVFNDALESLEGLNSLVSVFSSFKMSENPSLTDLTALSDLEYIGSKLIITENSALQTLSGLQNLNFCGGIQFGNNPSLSDISDLTNADLRAVEIGTCNSLINLIGLEGAVHLGDLKIANNDALVSLEGLNNLEQIVSFFQIDYNKALTSLEALFNLQTVGYEIHIYGNDALTSLEGLNSLTAITSPGEPYGYIGINFNATLNDITALENLSNVGEFPVFIELVENPALSSISGLQSLSADEIYGIRLTSSAELSTCNLPNFCEFLSDGGLNEITGNATGCNSQEEILELCELSLEEISVGSEVVLYPIPTKEILNIQVKEGVRIETVTLYDLNGRLILQSDENSTKIDVSNLNSGTYMVSVKTSNGIHNEKIIKK